MILIDTQKEEFTKLKDIRIFEKLDNGGAIMVICLSSDLAAWVVRLSAI